MRNMFRSRMAIYLFFTLTLPAIHPGNVHAQTSLLAEILRLQPAIVSIKSVNRDIMTGKPAIVGRDPKTGRILIHRKIASPSYNRYGAGVFIDAAGIIVYNPHILHPAPPPPLTPTP